MRPSWAWWLSCAVRLRELTREAVDMGDDRSTREYNRRALDAFRQLQGREVTCFDAWLRSLDGGLTPLLSRPRGVLSSAKTLKEPV